MSDQVERVRYLAVARLSDRLPIAMYAATNSSDMPKSLLDKKLERVLGSKRVGLHTRLTITDHDVGYIHYDTDPNCLYLVVSDSTYEQRLAFKLLGELRHQFDAALGGDVQTARHSSLSHKARDIMRSLCDKYNNVASVDKVAAISVQVDQVKGVMQQNINSVMRNTENIETLLDQTNAMKNEATGFQRTAAGVKQKMWWQNFRMQMLIGFLLVVLVLLIVVPIVVNRKNGKV